MRFASRTVVGLIALLVALSALASFIALQATGATVSAALGGMVLGALLVAFASAAGVLIAAYDTSRSMQGLVEAARRIRRGDKGVRADVPGTGPGTEVAAAFNELAGSLVSATRDLEERVAEKTRALAESEERFRLAVKGTNDGIWDWHFRTNQLYLSPRWKEMLGYGEAEFPDTFSEWASRVHPDDQARVGVLLKEISEGRHDLYEFESRMRHKNGEYRWMLTRGLLVRDPESRPARMVGSMSDITARREAEHVMAEARDAAESAARLKAEFVANMSHEIRTPMNAVIGMTDLLFATRLDTQQKEYAETIRTSGTHLLAIINDILDFSKIESGKMELRDAPFEIRKLVEDSAEQVAEAAQSKGLEVAYEIDPKTPLAFSGDAQRLRQILLNLLSNAVKFTDRGEVLLSVAARPKGGDRYDLQFWVKDTGIGIPEDQQDRLFESFTQVDASSTRAHGGTGLGLAISKRLVDLMGGRITLESRPGRGTTFLVTVPIEAIPVPEPRKPRGANVRLAGRRVLIVDDNATNRRILTLQAQGWGLEPREASGADAALEILRSKEAVDALILDYQMPKMDGAHLAREVRRISHRAHVPILLLTSVGRRPEETNPPLFDAVLTKPARQSVLYNALGGLLDREALVGRAEIRPAAKTPAPIGPSLLRILLAEDNPVNQKVALRLLETLGHRADVVENGEQALEAIERKRYDVALVDVQMPVMDGLTMARTLIERKPREERPYLIAITAHAMESDRETCLAAGMDDYLAKPVEREQLSAALSRAAQTLGLLPAPAARAEEPPIVATAKPVKAGKRKKRPDAEAAPPAPGPTRIEIPAAPERPPPKPAPGSAVDTRVLHRLRIEMGGQRAVADLLKSFLDDAPQRIAELRGAVVTSDPRALERAAHALKSSSAQFGAMTLAQLCLKLESMGRNRELDGAERVLGEVELAFRNAKRALEVERTRPVD